MNPFEFMRALAHLHLEGNGTFAVQVAADPKDHNHVSGTMRITSNTPTSYAQTFDCIVVGLDQPRKRRESSCSIANDMSTHDRGPFKSRRWETAADNTR